jgi:hypothetical protein
MIFDMPFMNIDADTKEEDTIMTTITLAEYRFLVQENINLRLKCQYLNEQIDRLLNEQNPTS